MPWEETLVFNWYCVGKVNQAEEYFVIVSADTRSIANSIARRKIQAIGKTVFAMKALSLDEWNKFTNPIKLSELFRAP
jgi:hypothetical protein